MMVPLPKVQADATILSLCTAVARGRENDMDAAMQMSEHLAAQRDGSTDLSRLSVIAVLLVEQLRPRARGLLMNRSQMEECLLMPDPIPEQHANMHLALLVCSCLQITATGAVRDGAHAIGTVLDRILPES